MLKHLDTSDWKWQLVKSSPEEWRASFIQSLGAEQELVGILVKNASSRGGAEAITKAVQDPSYPFWKLEYLSKATTPFEFTAIKEVESENILHYVFLPSQEWLKELLFDLVMQSQQSKNSEGNGSDSKDSGSKSYKLEIGRLAVIAKADYTWEAELLREIVFDEKELFTEKSELILACNEFRQGQKILESPAWKIPYLRNVLRDKHGNFLAMLEDIEPWQCDLLSRAGSALEVDIVKTEKSQIKAEAMIDNINVLSNWKRSLIEDCPEEEEWKLKYLFECGERWKGKAILECGEDEEWKIPLLSKETDATICKLIIEKCKHVWQAQILRKSYSYKPFLGDLIPKIEVEQEGWVVSSAEFEWQAEYVFNALKESFTKGIYLTKVMDMNRARYVAAAKEEWRYILLSDSRTSEDWMLPFLAAKECTEAKAALVTGCGFEWQARLVLEADSDWKAELLQSINREWRGKLVSEEKLEWKARYLANTEYDEYKVKLMVETDCEWKVKFITQAAESWRARLVTKLKDSEQALGEDLLNTGTIKTEEAALSKIRSSANGMYS